MDARPPNRSMHTHAHTPQVQTTEKEATAQDTVPDGGYGWVCVGCVFCVSMCTWGINCSYGVYLSYYLSNDVFNGATSLQFSFIGGVAAGLATLMGPPATYLVRLTSTKSVMFLGLVLQVGAIVAGSFATAFWQIFLTQGVVLGFGMGLIFSASIGTISQWFSKKRSLANGIVNGGSGVGGLAFSLGVQAIIDRTGSHVWALRMTAIINFVVMGICIIAIKDRNAQVKPNLRAFDVKLLGRSEFVCVLLWAFISVFGYTVIMFTLPDFAVSEGWTATQGSVLSALMNVGMAAGRPLIGLGADYFGRLNTSSALTILTGILCFALWIPAKTFGLACFFGVLSGGISGVFWTTISPVAVEVVGLKDLPSALALVWPTTTIPLIFSAPIVISMKQPGSPNPYLYPEIFCGLVYFVASGFILWVRAWKIAIDVVDAPACDAAAQGSTNSLESLEKSRWKSARAAILSLWAYKRV